MLMRHATIRHLLILTIGGGCLLMGCHNPTPANESTASPLPTLTQPKPAAPSAIAAPITPRANSGDDVLFEVRILACPDPTCLVYLVIRGDNTLQAHDGAGRSLMLTFPNEVGRMLRREIEHTDYVQQRSVGCLAHEDGVQYDFTYVLADGPLTIAHCVRPEIYHAPYTAVEIVLDQFFAAWGDPRLRPIASPAPCPC